MALNTVLEFIERMLKYHAGPGYSKEVSRVSRWWHRNSPTVVHLSPLLHGRLLRERGCSMASELNVAYPLPIEGGPIATNVPYPGREQYGFVISKGPWSTAYNPGFYGLQPETAQSRHPSA